jgi:L-iditol 2-dehydrogenase
MLRDIHDLVLEDVERPVCPPDGLLLKVATCAVCATDVKIYNYGHQLLQLPRVIGHELAGTLDEVGEELTGRFRPGERVAVCAVVNCGECIYCRRGIPSMCLDLKAFGYHYDGGYEEYMLIPARAIRAGGVNKLSPALSFEDASLAEPLACCVNGQRLSGAHLGQSMLILGAGPLGMSHALLARAQGLAPIYLADVFEQKLERARQICGPALAGTMLSNDNAALIQECNKITGGYGFDQVMVACSAPSAQQAALEIVARCGAVNFFGGLPRGHSQVSLDTNLIHYKQCRVVGTHGSSVEDNQIALNMIASGVLDVNPLITDRGSLDSLEDYLRLDGAVPDRLKAIITLS